MKVYFAADHAGFDLKKLLMAFVQDELKYEVSDCGAYAFDAKDDYPPIIAAAGKKLSEDANAKKDSRAIVIGASGQGEAIVMNRFRGVRCGLYYGQAAREQTDLSGKSLDMLASTRQHNDANALSLGARFLTPEEAKAAVKEWLTTAFSEDDRHFRRVHLIEEVA